MTPTQATVHPSLPISQPQSEAITRFGAAHAVWNAYHVADPRVAPGAAYDPTPGLGPDRRHDDRYYLVDPGDPITTYTERLPHGTSISLAKRAALAELPADGRVLWLATRDTCAQMELGSATLGRVLASLGDAAGEVFVEVVTETGAGDSDYDPRNANELQFMLGGYPHPADAPAC